MSNDVILNRETALTSSAQSAIKAERNVLRLSSTLLFVGVVLSLVVGLFHPDRAPANDHVAAFTDYANSPTWTAVHLGQFVGMAVITAGLLSLYFVLNIERGVSRWTARMAAIGACVELALYGVLQAIDGVALKQAVNAWANAPAMEKATRFASAEAIRWQEWGLRSYQSYMFGLTLILFGIVIVQSAMIPRLVGYFMGLSGLAYLVQGWVIGSEGFSANNTAPTLAAYLLIVIWSIWLLIISWRMKPVVEVPGG